MYSFPSVGVFVRLHRDMYACKNVLPDIYQRIHFHSRYFRQIKICVGIQNCVRLIILIIPKSDNMNFNSAYPELNLYICIHICSLQSVIIICLMSKLGHKRFIKKTHLI